MCVSSSGRHFSSHCSCLGETSSSSLHIQCAFSLQASPANVFATWGAPKHLTMIQRASKSFSPVDRSLKTKRVLSLAEVRKRGRFQRICSRATEGGAGADCHEQPCSPLVTCCQALSSGVFSCFFCVWVILLHFAQFVQTPTQVCCVFSDSSLCPDPGHFHISLER